MEFSDNFSEKDFGSCSESGHDMQINNVSGKAVKKRCNKHNISEQKYKCMLKSIVDIL